MAEHLTPKRPGETVAYMDDWSRQIGADPIESHTLTVSSGTVTITEQEAFAQFIRFVVAGGADGETATFASEIVTKGGQTLTRVIELRIEDDASAITPQTTTKRTIVEMAFEEIGLAGYEFDESPEEQFSALRRLDSLMADWRTQSLDLGYNFPLRIGTGNLNETSGIPDNALNAVVMSLALRIMPAIGKTMSPETRVALAQGMSSLRTAYAVIPERRLAAGTPRGAGAWWYGQPYRSGSF